MLQASAHRAIALMREASRLYTQLFAKHFKALSLTSEEARTLAYLGAEDGVTQKDLAAVMHVRPIGLSRLIDRLQDGGWLERRQSPADRRANTLHLTEKGKAGAQDIRAINSTLADRLAGDLPADDLASLVRGLEVVRAALEEMR